MEKSASYMFIASMDVESEKENLFNEVYDQEHVPTLLKVPGVLSIYRATKERLVLSMGGKEEEILSKEPRYSAFYLITNPNVLVSDDWARAIEEGRWPLEVRPFTFNRQHVLRKVRD